MILRKIRSILSSQKSQKFVLIVIGTKGRDRIADELEILMARQVSLQVTARRRISMEGMALLRQVGSIKKMMKRRMFLRRQERNLRTKGKLIRSRLTS